MHVEPKAECLRTRVRFPPPPPIPSIPRCSSPRAPIGHGADSSAVRDGGSESRTRSPHRVDPEGSRPAGSGERLRSIERTASLGLSVEVQALQGVRAHPPPIRGSEPARCTAGRGPPTVLTGADGGGRAGHRASERFHAVDRTLLGESEVEAHDFRSTLLDGACRIVERRPGGSGRSVRSSTSLSHKRACGRGVERAPSARGGRRRA